MRSDAGVRVDVATEEAERELVRARHVRRASPIDGRLHLPRDVGVPEVQLDARQAAPRIAAIRLLGGVALRDEALLDLDQEDAAHAAAIENGADRAEHVCVGTARCALIDPQLALSLAA